MGGWQGDIGWVICASDPSVRVGRGGLCGVISTRARVVQVKWCVDTLVHSSKN
jgi:hypothetical protein